MAAKSHESGRMARTAAAWPEFSSFGPGPAARAVAKVSDRRVAARTAARWARTAARNMHLIILRALGLQTKSAHSLVRVLQLK